MAGTSGARGRFSREGGSRSPIKVREAPSRTEPEGLAGEWPKRIGKGDHLDTAPYVLVIEDDPAMANTIARAVGHLVPVLWVATANDAVDVFRGDLPLCGVFVDVRLAMEGDGLDALEMGREYRPELPALVLTGFCDAPFQRRAFELRALLLPKPARPDDLESWMRDALGLTDPLAGHRATILEFDRRWNVGLDDLLIEVLVLALACRGRKEIAEALGKTEHGIKSRRRRILNLFRDAGLRRR